MKFTRLIVFIAVILLASPSLHAEYGVGVRSVTGGNAIFGKRGARDFLGMPGLGFSGPNRYVGWELFGEIQISHLLYVEPHVGVLSVNREAEFGGVTTNLNGVISVSDDIIVRQTQKNVSFGAFLKGKTPGLRKYYRFSAAIGFQFTRASTNLISFTRVQNKDQGRVVRDSNTYAILSKPVSEAGAGELTTSPEQIVNTTEIDAKNELNPWGMRFLTGFGFDIVFAKLGGVVFHHEIRAGWDLSFLLFTESTVKDFMEKHGDKVPAELNVPNVKHFYIEGVASFYMAVSYRLPVGKLARRRSTQKVVPKRPTEVSEEE